MKSTKAHNPRCASCGRKLENPVVIAGLLFGSECQHKAAGLEGYLKAHDLEFPTSIPMLPGSSNDFYCPDVDRIRMARNACARAGINTLTINNFEGVTPTTEIHVDDVNDALERISMTPGYAAFQARAA